MAMSTTPSQHAVRINGGRRGRPAEKALTVAARLGYAARGAVYLMVGVLALLSAATGTAQAEGSRGAIASLLDEPFGQILLVVIGVGLVGYAVWRFMQGAFDADGHGADLKGSIVRAGLFVSAITHAGLALYALSLAFNWGSTGGGADGSGSTAWLLSRQGGRIAVGVIGACVIGAGIAQFVKGARSGFKKWLNLNAQTMRKVSPICRFGLIARGFSFVLIGSFLVRAAWRADPSETRGLGGAIQSLRDEPYGLWLMGATAVGLLAFSLYSFIEAGARRVQLS